MRKILPSVLLGVAATLVFAALAVAPAAAAGAVALDGRTLSPAWAAPFLGILLSIAIFPLVAPRLWHRHFGKITLAWAVLTALPLAASRGVDTALSVLDHALIGEYVSFIALLFALYVVAGGILISGNLRGTPFVNAMILAFGTLIASIVGTTGASMILIRLLLRANAARLRNVHVMVFFIFLVGNIGGALSPLGDPPLFIGFLSGVEFFWPAKHLWQPTAFVAAATLALFIVIDWWLYSRDRLVMPVEEIAGSRLRLRGGNNLSLLAVIIAAVILSAQWSPGVSIAVYDTPLPLQDVARDAVLFLTAFVSLWLTPDQHRQANGFSWEPIQEVAILFAGIFVCATPVMAILDAGHDGALAPLIAAVTTHDGKPHDVAFFWLTGALSAILDNAPTYLVFFKLAGGNAVELMGPLASTLAAISMAAVYMGAFTYIGNAPNFMICAIARERGIKMPSFFGYMAWSILALGPVLAGVTYLYVWPR